MSHETSAIEAVERSIPTPVRPSFLARRLQKLIAPAQHGRLIVRLPDGSRIEHRGSKSGVEAAFTVTNWRTVWSCLMSGSMGFAESYVAGHWSTPDLSAVLEWIASNRNELNASSDGTALSRWTEQAVHALRRNTRRNSRRNIAAHYDLGNQFYALWLDAGMNYSSAIFTRRGMSLEDAQAAKIDAVAELLELPAPTQTPLRVLEIGCGWGAVMERLTRSGHGVTGLTLSQAQRTYAIERLSKLRSEVAWDVRLEDYRDVQGSFDRIVSIEMIEAVGEAYWPVYFEQIRDRLKPGGVAVMQAITIEAARYESYRSSPDFIQRYIFPGGMLPTRQILDRQIRAAGLLPDRTIDFGQSYAFTLEAWRHRFVSAWGRIEPMGFDQRFKRMWEFYLAYCEAGFRQGAIDVHLFQFRRPA